VAPASTPCRRRNGSVSITLTRRKTNAPPGPSLEPDKGRRRIIANMAQAPQTTNLQQGPVQLAGTWRARPFSRNRPVFTIRFKKQARSAPVRNLRGTFEPGKGSAAWRSRNISFIFHPPCEESAREFRRHRDDIAGLMAEEPEGQGRPKLRTRLGPKRV